MAESKSLIALVKEAQTLFQVLAENGGELTPELETMLANIDVKLPEKIDAYKVMLDRAEAEEAYWRKRADEMQSIARGLANLQASLKDRLKFVARETNQSELVGHEYKFKIANGKSKLVIDEKKLDTAYMMQVVTQEIDKKRIEEDLRIGVPVAGASLEETKSIRAYLNKR